MPLRLFALLLLVAFAVAEEDDPELARAVEDYLDSDLDTVVICYLNQDSLKHARFAVRRLKRIDAALRVGVALWKPGEDEEEPDLKAAVAAGAALNADFLCTDMTTAAIAALTKAPVVPLAAPGKVRARRRLVADRPKVVSLR